MPLVINQPRLAPGSLAAVKGSNLSFATAQASGSPYPITLGGVTVYISGEACPLLYVSSSQINFLIPADLPPGCHLLSVGSATSDAF